jgi:hypothetical protein
MSLLRESTTSANFDIQPQTWTTTDPKQPLQWFTQEGRACTIGGKSGVLKRVGDKMVCDTSMAGEITSGSGVKESGGVNPDSPLSDPEVAKLKGLGRNKVHKTLFNRNYHATSYGPSSGDLFQRSFKHPSGHRVDVHFDGDEVARRAQGIPAHEENEDTMDTIQEAVTLRFSSPSRTQIAKQAVYWDIHRRMRSGLAKIRVGRILGAPGNWYFDVGSESENQFLDPGRMNNILVGGVTVTKSSASPEGAPHLASQIEPNNVIREKVREMVAKKLGLKEAGTYHVFDPSQNVVGKHYDKKDAIDQVRDLGPGHTVGYEDNGAPAGFIGHMYDHEGHEMHWSRNRSAWVKSGQNQ